MTRSATAIRGHLKGSADGMASNAKMTESAEAIEDTETIRVPINDAINTPIAIVASRGESTAITPMLVATPFPPFETPGMLKQ